MDTTQTSEHATELLRQIGPSIVAATLETEIQSYTFPAVVVGKGVVAAYEALIRRPGATFENLLDIKIRKGDRFWTAECNNVRPDWQTCAVAPKEDVDLPAVIPRWSRTVSKGERLWTVDLEESIPDHGVAARSEGVFAVAGVIYQTFPPDPDKKRLEPYERSQYMAARFDAEPRMGALVFDDTGALAGCIEVHPQPTDSYIVIPGEWLTGYDSFHFAYLLSSASVKDPEVLGQLFEMFIEECPRSQDPRFLCLASQFYERFGDAMDAIWTLGRALELQPEDPWILEQFQRINEALDLKLLSRTKDP
jgi:hypothetical protein